MLWISPILMLLTAVTGKLLLIDPVFDTANLVLKDAVNTLIVGASHSACAFNPNLFDNAVSAANDGEPIFLTYHKAKTVIEKNEGIKTIVMAFSPLHLSKSQDFNLFSRNAASRNFHMNYFMLIDNEGRKFLDKSSEDFWVAKMKYDFGLPLSYMSDLPLIINHYMDRNNCFSYDFWGGFNRTNGVHLEDDSIIKKTNYYFYDSQHTVLGVSEIAIEHLKKIIELCENKSIQLIMVNTPKHRKYRIRTPLYYHTEYQKFVEKHISDTDKNILYLDFAKVGMEDSMFFDGDHLNKIGSDFFWQNYLVPVLRALKMSHLIKSN